MFTVDEYQRAVYGNDDFRKLVGSLLDSKTFLFLGCSLAWIEDFATGFLASDLETEDEGKHFAVVPWQPDIGLQQERFRKYGIRLVVFRPTPGFPEMPDFVDRLRDVVREQRGELHIGATATMADLAGSELARTWAGGALAAAAAAAGSTPLRNLITAGGNLASLYPWSDLPPALLVVDARVHLAGPAGPEITSRIEEIANRIISKGQELYQSAVLTLENSTKDFQKDLENGYITREQSDLVGTILRLSKEEEGLWHLLNTWKSP